MTTYLAAINMRENFLGEIEIAMPSSNDQLQISTIPISDDRLIPSSNLDRLKQIVRDIDIDRPLQVKTEDEITRGNLKFGNFFKAKFAHRA